MRPTDAIKADCARVMKRAKKATPRPWRWWTSCSHVRLSSDASGGDGDVLRGDMAFHDRQATVICGLDDREHITEACNTAPTIAQDALDLLGEVERLRAPKEATIPTLDCGDNGCLFATARGGMRTNGGCRCLDGAGFSKGLHHAAREMLPELLRLRARLAECGPGIERLRDLQQAYAGGGDYMRQLLEALEVKLPTKEPS